MNLLKKIRKILVVASFIIGTIITLASFLEPVKEGYGRWKGKRGTREACKARHPSSQSKE